MKIIGICLILSSFFTFTYKFKAQICFKIKFLEQLIKSIEFIESELSFSNTSTKNIFLKLSKNTKQPLADIFLSWNDSSSWESIFEKKLEKQNFRPYEVELILSIGNILGKYDSNEQIKLLKYTKNKLIDLMENEKNFLKSEVNLIKSTAILCAIVLIIVLI